MAHPNHCLVTQKLQSMYFNVLYAYFIIGPNIQSHYGCGQGDITRSNCKNGAT